MYVDIEVRLDDIGNDYTMVVLDDAALMNPTLQLLNTTYIDVWNASHVTLVNITPLVSVYAHGNGRLMRTVDDAIMLKYCGFIVFEIEIVKFGRVVNIGIETDWVIGFVEGVYAYAVWFVAIENSIDDCYFKDEVDDINVITIWNPLVLVTTG